MAMSDDSPKGTVVSIELRDDLPTLEFGGTTYVRHPHGRWERVSLVVEPVSNDTQQILAAIYNERTWGL